MSRRAIASRSAGVLLALSIAAGGAAAADALKSAVTGHSAGAGQAAKQATAFGQGAAAKAGAGATEAGRILEVPNVPAIRDTLELAGEMDDLLLFPPPYAYTGAGRRDLFASLVTEDFQAEAGGGGDGRPSTDDLCVVGILWAERDRFALVETGDGRSMLLREGDSLGDGIVAQVHPDRIVVHVSEYGTSRNVTLLLAQGGEIHENRRSRNR